MDEGLTCEVDVEIGDLELVCEVGYLPTRSVIIGDDPLTSSDAEGGLQDIISVLCGGQDISFLLSKQAYDRIWLACSEALDA
jgi:hypothetical protein